MHKPNNKPSQLKYQLPCINGGSSLQNPRLQPTSMMIKKKVNSSFLIQNMFNKTLQWNYQIKFDRLNEALKFSASWQRRTSSNEREDPWLVECILGSFCSNSASLCRTSSTEREDPWLVECVLGSFCSNFASFLFKEQCFFSFIIWETMDSTYRNNPKIQPIKHNNCCSEPS